MDFKSAQRLVLIVMALFPTMWGFLGVLNDATDFSGTVQNAVKPMIEMADTYGNPSQTVRAIHWPGAATVGLIGIMVAEGLAGIFGLLGLIVMLRTFRGTKQAFERGKALMILGCLCGVLVWGIGFMVVAGDWFLAWQAKTNPLATQLSALIYFLPNAMGILVAMAHRED